MVGSIKSNLQTLNLYEKKDPIVVLWRAVLSVGVEDLLNKKEIQIRYNQKNPLYEEEWFNDEDFELVCEFAQMSPSMIRKKIHKAIKRMKESYGTKTNEINMPKMPWKRLYQGSTRRI